MSLDFPNLDWRAWVFAAALVLVACKAPGEDFEGLASDATSSTQGPASNTTASSNDATTATASSTGGSGSTSTTNGTSTSQGGASSTGGASTTTDSSVESTTDGGTTGGVGGSGSTTDTGTEGTTGGVVGDNVIDNFDFETSSDPCTVDESDWSTEGDVNWSGADDEICGYCIVLDPGQSGQLNWSGNAGTAPTLEAGSYRFMFDVISNDGTAPNLSVKVGQPVDPFTGFLEEDVSVSDSTSTFDGSFSLDTSDQVGIAFFVSAGNDWGKICFDNVVIASQ